MEETKHTSRNPSKSPLSLKDIPPLDPSSIPFTSSLKPNSRMGSFHGENQSWESESVMKTGKRNEIEDDDDDDDDEDSSSSTIHVDPNSTISRDMAQERNRVPGPEEDLVYNTRRPRIEAKRGSVKSQLHDTCLAIGWKLPVYECCKVEGSSHSRMYTYKVTVEIESSSGTTVLECFGAPQSNKKTAAEHAAEGALWYLIR